METIADVDIDPHGKFKYILIEVADANNVSKLIVRGYADCAYHADIFDKVTPGLEAQQLTCKCLGGGKIFHDSDSKRLKVSGYSQGYGKAPHEKTVEVLRKKYVDYDISCSSDEGY